MQCSPSKLIVPRIHIRPISKVLFNSLNVSYLGSINQRKVNT